MPMSSQTVSYPCLKSIVPSLPFFLRARLHQKCSHVKAISRSIDFTAKHVKFSQPHVFLTGLPCFPYKRCYSATLTVDNVTWNFRFDDVTQKVHVTCSLYPGREVVSERKELARETLAEFLTLRVEHLELESVVAPFLHPMKLNCPRLTLRINEVYMSTTLGLSNMGCHRFDVVEIVDAGRASIVLFEKVCLRARRLIMRDDRIAINNLSIDLVFNWALTNQLVQLTMRPEHADVFVSFCAFFTGKKWQNGSFVDFSYPKSRLLRDNMWELLSNKYPKAVNATVDEKQILILDGTDEYVLYVEHIENEERQRFKVTKEANPQMLSLFRKRRRVRSSRRGGKQPALKRSKF